MGYGRSSGGNDDSPFGSVSAPFSQDEFPALGGMGGESGQRQGLPSHMGQSNGVYDPRQQGSQSIMTPPPNLGQVAQDHRQSMLEALQQGQRGVPPRTGMSPNIMAGIRLTWRY
jgi:hypothetical protein